MQTILFKNTIIIIVGYKWKKSLLKIFFILESCCVYVKRITLCNYLYSSSPSSSCFSDSRIRDFGIVRRYSWFWKSLNMADRGGEFSFFQDIYVRTDIRIDISISIRFMTTKFGKQVHVGELTQMSLIELNWGD